MYKTGTTKLTVFYLINQYLMLKFNDFQSNKNHFQVTNGNIYRNHQIMKLPATQHIECYMQHSKLNEETYTSASYMHV